MFTEGQKMHTCKKCKVAVMYVKCFFSKQACKANWDAKTHCAVPENIHTPPTEGIGISWVVRDSIRPKNVKKSMELNWDFQRGGGALRKKPFRGEGMDIFWNYTLFNDSYRILHKKKVQMKRTTYPLMMKVSKHTMSRAVIKFSVICSLVFTPITL